MTIKARRDMEQTRRTTRRVIRKDASTNPRRGPRRRRVSKDASDAKNRLSDIKPSEVSLVGAGANRWPLLVTKGDGETPIPEGATIQSLIFSSKAYNLETASEWADENDFPHRDLAKTEDAVHITLHDGESFNPDGFGDAEPFRTLKISDDIQAVVGFLEKGDEDPENGGDDDTPPEPPPGDDEDDTNDDNTPPEDGGTPDDPPGDDTPPAGDDPTGDPTNKGDGGGSRRVSSDKMETIDSGFKAECLEVAESLLGAVQELVNEIKNLPESEHEADEWERSWMNLPVTVSAQVTKVVALAVGIEMKVPWCMRIAKSIQKAALTPQTSNPTTIAKMLGADSVDNLSDSQVGMIKLSRDLLSKMIKTATGEETPSGESGDKVDMTDVISRLEAVEKSTGTSTTKTNKTGGGGGDGTPRRTGKKKRSKIGPSSGSTSEAPAQERSTTNKSSGKEQPWPRDMGK